MLRPGPPSAGRSSVFGEEVVATTIRGDGDRLRTKRRRVPVVACVTSWPLLLVSRCGKGQEDAEGLAAGRLLSEGRLPGQAVKSHCQPRRCENAEGSGRRIGPYQSDADASSTSVVFAAPGLHGIGASAGEAQTALGRAGTGEVSLLPERPVTLRHFDARGNLTHRLLHQPPRVQSQPVTDQTSTTGLREAFQWVQMVGRRRNGSDRCALCVAPHFMACRCQ